MKLSIIIPCFNEEKNIPLILERFKNIISTQDIEVILVNNGSTDGSQAVLDKLLPNFTFAKTVLVEKNKGYGYGILMGLKNATGEYIGWTHADMQTDPADVLKAYIIANKMLDNNVFIKGNRKNRYIFDSIFTAGMSVFESIYMKKILYDINAQPTVFPKKFYDQWKNPPNDFSLDLYSYYMALNSGLKIKRFPVLFEKRIHGKSSWNTGILAKWKFIKRTINYSIRLKNGGIE